MAAKGLTTTSLSLIGSILAAPSSREVTHVDLAALHEAAVNTWSHVLTKGTC